LHLNLAANYMLGLGIA